MGKLADINAERNQAAGVQDRLGRTLEAGDFIVANPQTHTLIQVTDVRPQMNLTGPKGHVISGVAQFQFFAPSGKRLPDLLFVMRPRKSESEAQDDGVIPTGGTVVKHEPGSVSRNGSSLLAGVVRRWFGR